jgi:hypothetical protein
MFRLTQQDPFIKWIMRVESTQHDMLLNGYAGHIVLATYLNESCEKI